ncbi:RacO protein [Streptomyces microflavus DSM 40593]|uniref:RacO protein n=2 Tax=Streptomyces TaxID=1883 RepID=N0CMY1_STRMI|nr:RacO protein [Streptomyces microflavus DSM 40593]
MVKAMSEQTENIGSVSQSRYEQIVAELRKVVEQQTRGKFTIGDRALEIEPVRPRGGIPDAEWTVRESLVRLAEDIGLTFNTVKNARWIASRWPKEHRQADVSFTIHRILGRIEADQERWAAIKNPPEGKSRWTADDAKRRVGWTVDSPETPQERITAIHHLAQDEEVAATVTTDFLRRPQVAAKVSMENKVRVVEELTRDEQVATTAATNLLRRPDVAFKAMSDDTARFQVNHAQNERSRQARQHFEDTSPVAPAVRNIDRTVEFLDLVTACHAFVAAVGRTVPGLRDRTLSEDERTIVHQNVAKVKATLDWIETAVDTGKVDMDGELAAMLRGE